MARAEAHTGRRGCHWSPPPLVGVVSGYSLLILLSYLLLTNSWQVLHLGRVFLYFTSPLTPRCQCRVWLLRVVGGCSNVCHAWPIVWRNCTRYRRNYCCLSANDTIIFRDTSEPEVTWWPHRLVVTLSLDLHKTSTFAVVCNNVITLF